MTEDRTWTVVQFQDDTVEAVPTVWIQGDLCHWPSLAPPKLMMAIRKIEPLNTCWPTHKVKVFRNATFDDYMRARNKAKTAEETSDLASEREGNYKRKRIQKVLSSSGSSEESLLPSPPKFKQCYSAGTVMKVDGSGNGTFKKADVSGNEDQENEVPVFISPIQEKNFSCPLSEESIFHPYVDLQENGTTQTISKFCCQGCKDNESKLKVIIEQNHLIRSITTDLLSKMNAMGEIHDYQKSQGVSIYKDFNLDFPLNSEEDLEKFETVLKEGKNFDAAVNELAKLGGSTNYNFVKRVMTSLIRNEEASKFSWLGRKGKKPFNKLNMARLVLDAAEKANKAQSRKETENSLQSWIKRARERENCRSKKF